MYSRKPTLPPVWMDVCNAPIDTTPVSDRRETRRHSRVQPFKTNVLVGFWLETKLWRSEMRLAGVCFVNQLSEYADVTCALRPLYAIL